MFHDKNIDRELAEKFNFQLIQGMGHFFFGFEEEIALTINQAIKN